MLARVASLFVFPVKACAGLAVDRLVFTDGGRVEGDREWAITDAAGQVTWQGEHPLLALVQPVFEVRALVLQAPGGATLRLPRDGTGQAVEVRIWNDVDKRNEAFAAMDAGTQASAFLHAVTGVDLRLVRLGDAALARDHLNAVHLLSQASLDELNQALKSRGLAVAEMQRFRPNIVLEGEALMPFLEEHLTRLTWGESGELQGTSPCVRCIVPNVNPATGAVDAEPAPTVAELSAQRRPGAPSTLGLYARPTCAAVLTQGTTVQLELSL